MNESHHTFAKFREACLTCPMFVTTAEFLPEHRRQLDATRTLIERAEQHGQQRMAEMNRTVENNLLAIIGGLSRPDACCGNSCQQSSSCACASTSARGDNADDVC